jgi:non-specific serine/threonine protein kinase/serine/threonine-protein kinase
VNGVPPEHSESHQNTGTAPASDLIESIALEAIAIEPQPQPATNTSGTGSDQTLEQFRSIIPALCRHPNIAEFDDAGRAGDWQHRFTPEPIDGEQIDTYCNQRRLDVPARLRLFADVCRAVHFAHQHAVLHGDLKPSNILVTADGAPKLLGFRFTRPSQPVEPSENLLTDEPPAAGSKPTVYYTDPERIKGEPATTATDVYALGILLYRLLTDRWPYWTRTESTSEILRAICEQAPEKPSKAVSSSFSQGATLDEIAAARRTVPRRLKRILKGDLDAIVLTALRKEPETRYPSAAHFAEDVDRCLQGLPVRARGKSLAYGTAKRLQRNPVLAVSALAFTLAVVAGIALTTIGLLLARRQRDQARDSFRQAHQTIDQLFDHVSENRLLEEPVYHPIRVTLLEDAERFYEDLLNRSGTDSTARIQQSEALTRIARIARLTGKTAQAISQYQKAVALCEDLVASQPRNHAFQESLARNLSEMGIALMLSEGHRDQALLAFRRAQKLLEPLVTLDAGSLNLRHQLSLILQNIAQMERDQGHLQSAMANIVRSMAIAAQLLAQEPQSLDFRISAARVHRTLAQIVAGQPDGLDQACTAYQCAVDLLEPVTNEHPELAEVACELAVLLGDLSSCQRSDGKLDSALGSVQKALAIFEKLHQEYPRLAKYQSGLGSAYNVLSDLHRLRREPAESRAAARKASTLLDQLVSDHPDDALARADLARSHNAIGRIHQQLGEPIEALRSFKRAIDLYESIPRLDPRDSYNLAANLSLCIPLIGAPKGSQGSLDALNLTKSDQLHRQLYGDRALDLLRRATAGGFLNAEILRSDTDIDALRDRPDFQSLQNDVEAHSASNHD